MPPVDMDYLKRLTVHPLDPGLVPTGPLPLTTGDRGREGRMVIPLSEFDDPAQRLRLLIADDDRDVIAALAVSRDRYAKALDVRLWQADKGEDLLVCLDRMAAEGWRPQLLVLDINLAHGGKTGLEYLKQLRQTPGWASLAVVLATSQYKRDLDADRLSGRNLTGLNPKEWLERAKPWEPEAILYGKEGSAHFLGRMGESLPTWRQIARRRVWHGLLDAVARQLDGTPDIDTVGQIIVEQANRELDIDHIFVRWRKAGSDQFKLVAFKAPEGYVSNDDLVRIDELPLLGRLVDRKTLLESCVTAADLGRFSAMAGRRFMGVAAMLENRIVGFVTVFREPQKASFDLEVDGKPLGILGRLLASAFGREDAINRLRERQAALLEFANDLAKQTEREGVCAVLAQFLHLEFHGEDNSESKTTVRLVDFGSGKLERLANAGLQCDGAEISFLTAKSVYAAAVRENKVIRCEDIEKPPCSDLYQASVDGIHSELCVPLAVGDHAVGAVNLEHKQVAKYKEHDLPFVQSAAALAANALEHLHGSKFAESLLAFVENYAGYKADEAEVELRDKLHEFCGYSVLLTMTPSDLDDLARPWRLDAELDMRLKGGDAAKIKKTVNELAQNEMEWAQTWVAQLLNRNAWQSASAHFTKNPNEFQKIYIACEGDICYQQQADAVLWIRHPNKPPHGLILLLWALPPFLGKFDEQALERFARLFSALQAREQRIRTLLEERVLGEQAAAIGHVMQHFRHRLVNNTGGLNGHLLTLEAASKHEDIEGVRVVLPDLRATVTAIANSFGKAQGYVKIVEAGDHAVADCVAPARDDLKERLEPFCLEECIPDGLRCWTDPVIASLILYGLLENAADALAGRGDGRIVVSATKHRDGTICLRVADNGPGFPQGKIARLWRFGFTTKSKSLGSALAFAKVRARALGAELRLAPEQPAAGGAAFELLLPGDRVTFEKAVEQMAGDD